MADWVNNGSLQDLSGLAKNSIAPTSQAGGNMMSSNEEAMTAPGSEPVDPLPDRDEQGNPAMTVSGPQIAPGTDGKPHADDHDGDDQDTASYKPGAPSWGRTTRPSVVRGK